MTFILLICIVVMLIVLYGNLKTQQQLMERLIEDIELMLIESQKVRNGKGV